MCRSLMASAQSAFQLLSQDESASRREFPQRQRDPNTVAGAITNNGSDCVGASGRRTASFNAPTASAGPIGDLGAEDGGPPPAPGGGGGAGGGGGGGGGGAVPAQRPELARKAEPSSVLNAAARGTSCHSADSPTR